MGLFTSDYLDAEGLRLPETEVGADFHLDLYECTGKTDSTLTRTWRKRFDLTQSAFTWSFRRIGGCGQCSLKLAGGFPDMEDMKGKKWELDFNRVKSDDTLELWYRGIIEAPTIKDGIATLSGFGYVADLETIPLSNVVFSGLTVAAAVKSLLDTYILPNSRITYDPGGLADPGDVEGDYVIGNVRFDGFAFHAVELLAELQGSTEWGVRPDRTFYFKPVSDTLQAQNSYFVAGDLFDAAEEYLLRAGTAQGANIFGVVGGLDSAGAIVTGSHDGSGESDLGQRAYNLSRPQIRSVADANRVCLNWFTQCQAGQTFYRGQVPVHNQDGVPRRIESMIPVGTIRFSNGGEDVTAQLWQVDYQYREGQILVANIEIGVPPPGFFDVYAKVNRDVDGANYSRALQTGSSVYAPAVGPNDIEVTNATKGLVQRSPNGKRWRQTLDDSGVPVWTEI